MGGAPHAERQRARGLRRSSYALVAGLIHHSDAASQHISIRYTSRLVEAGAVALPYAVRRSCDIVSNVRQGARRQEC